MAVQREGTVRSRTAQVVALAFLAAVLYWSYYAVLRSPLMLLWGKEPRAKVGLAEVARVTGWRLPPRTRVAHGERRSWLGETVLAELEMPKHDAAVLLDKLKQGQQGDYQRAYSMSVSDPPYWWKPVAASSENVVEVWSTSPSSEPVLTRICIIGRADGMARLYLLRVEG